MTSFSQRKKKILKALDVSSSDYTDLSPKGSVDEGIFELIKIVNDIPGLVTTSSCAGRVSVYVEGKKKSATVSEDSEAIASPGGKGGGQWIFVSHDPLHLEGDDWSSSTLDKFGFLRVCASTITEDASLLHVKFESMILHVSCASVQDASSVLAAAFEAGFRESGAMSLPNTLKDDSNLMVGVRSNGLFFDSIIGYQATNGTLYCTVDDEHIKSLLRIANSRFKTNFERTTRFQAAITKKFNTVSVREDAETRRQRKKAEGLARQQAFQTSESNKESIEDIDPSISDLADLLHVS